MPLDSNTIDCCLFLFDRAPFRFAKPHIRLHSLHPLRRAMACLIHISDDKIAVDNQVFQAVTLSHR